MFVKLNFLLSVTNNVIFSLRHILAAVHFNYNLNREIKKNSSGEEQVSVIYPKFKNGEATVRSVRVKQNFGKLTFTLLLYPFVCFTNVLNI